MNNSKNTKEEVIFIGYEEGKGYFMRGKAVRSEELKKMQPLKSLYKEIKK